MKNKRFVKMHGTGNDFIIVQPEFFGLTNQRKVVNTFTQEQKGVIVPQVISLCRQRFGIGANGVLVVSQVGNKYYKMSVFNSDGCMGANCGNGLRCIAVYLHKTKQLGYAFNIATDSGDKWAEISIQNKQYFVRINLSTPSPISQVNFNGNTHPIFAKYLTNSSIYSCQIGNSHLVIFLQQKQFQRIGQNNAYFSIANELVGNELINVNFCCVQSSRDMKIVTCQFGAGVTLACGTGSSASAFVGFSTGRLENEVNVHTNGGVLIISIEKGQKGVQVFLNGPAKWVFSGEIQSQ